ncbi:sigma-70 family RNA polymerase sigma factor [Sporosarcina psychrophila]|uniref:sigma-70 family RNA polymerase sigma factor n=1 Tax=Sporosarcina psychrophila TaxID=1476 RepID=UPI00078E03C6|nr:sigma-70 family RNA polymerase sigma factor [Sporosarcina psychrophila]AMQ07797.1 hypothetical protein AZE41_18645 [Sporosarcina psychrophila]
MIDELRKESQFEENVMQTEDESLQIINDIATPVTAEWRDCLVNAMDRLTLAEQQLVQRLFIEGFTLSECAEQYGIKVAGVKKLRERMLVKLRNELTG